MKVDANWNGGIPYLRYFRVAGPPPIANMITTFHPTKRNAWQLLEWKLEASAASSGSVILDSGSRPTANHYIESTMPLSISRTGVSVYGPESTASMGMGRGPAYVRSIKTRAPPPYNYDNPGDREAAVSARIIGPVTNPVLRREGGNAYVAYARAVGAGGYVDLDFQRRTVSGNARHRQRKSIHASGFPWWSIPPGRG